MIGVRGNVRINNDSRTDNGGADSVQNTKAWRKSGRREKARLRTKGHDR